jgi:hypothetical protein
VCTLTALDIWNNIGQVPNTNKNFLLVRTDSRGTPALIADHFFANTTGKLENAAVDARDFFVTYKLSVAALDCAFRNRNCTAALGAGAPVQVGMGSWSDGVPVKTMLYSDDPNTLTPACLQRWPWSSLK